MKLDSSLAAIVTGGASGLGEATARMLAGQGVKVALLDLNAERGEAIAKEIGGVFALCDVTSEASVDEALAKARAAHGVARIIVNCAGIAPGRRVVSKKRDTGELIAHDLATFEKAVAINLTGTFRIIAKSAVALAGLDPVTEDGGRGVIICTASVAAEDGQIGQAAYGASKAGVVGLTLPPGSASASSRSCPACSKPRCSPACPTTPRPRSPSPCRIPRASAARLNMRRSPAASSRTTC